MENESELFEQILNELKYLVNEGFVRVQFDPDYPGDYTRAVFFRLSDEEIQKEIEALY